MKAHDMLRSKGLRILVGLAFSIYVGYLITGNILVNSDWIQSRFNRNPDQISISWEKGYTLFPARFYLANYKMHVKKNHHDWSLNLDNAWLKLSPWPLLARKFHASSLRVEGGDFQYRFIRNPSESENRPSSGKKRWEFTFEDIGLKGIRSLALQDLSIKGNGQGEGSFRMELKGELQVHPIRLVFQDATCWNGKDKIAQKTDLDFQFQTDSFEPSSNKGKQALKFMVADLDFTGELSSLEIPQTLFKKLSWLKIEDQGHFQGQVHFSHGVFLRGSRVGVQNTGITAQFQDLNLSGTGRLDLVLQEEIRELDAIHKVRLEIEFNKYELNREDLDHPMIAGDGFGIRVESPFFDLVQPFKDADIYIEMPHAVLADVRDLNAYLGEQLFLEILEGSATVSGQFQFQGEKREGAGVLSFASKDVSIQVKDNVFSGGFELRTQISKFCPESPRVLFTGSSLTLENPSKKWISKAILEEGFLQWSPEVLKNNRKKVLTTAIGDFKVTADLSDIGFLNSFFKGQHGFALHGEGSLEGDFKLAKGRLGGGTAFMFLVPSIQASFLKYSALGNATLRGGIKDKGKKQSANLQLEIQNYSVARKDSSLQHSSGRILSTSIVIPDFSLTNRSPKLELKISLPEDNVPDMGTYNFLWGGTSAFQILSGSGVSHGELTFSSTTGRLDGQFNLSAQTLKARYEDLPITTDLTFSGTVRSKDLDSMVFDFKGSNLLLDHVFTGDTAPRENWQLNCRFQEAELRWQDPVLIQGRMQFDMTDTRPLVALFSEKSGIVKVFKHVLNIQNIHGESDFDLNAGFFDIHDLNIFGDDLEMRGKTRLGSGLKRGALFIEFKGVPFWVSMEGEKKRPHFIHSETNYEDFPVFIPPGLQ